LKYQIGAAIEVIGRLIIDRFPKLRKFIARQVRKPVRNAPPVEISDFAATLSALEIGQGDSLMVHSAWDGMRQLRAKPSEVIETLKMLVGNGGTLIMPTGPIEQMREGMQVYNIEKSPSSLGLLSESFRRMPDVSRSPFPMGTVSAWGKLAGEFTKDFYRASDGTPYGPGSPYWKMRDYNGKVLIIGIDFIRVLSLSHCAFDILGNDNPLPDYHIEKPYIVINKGKEETVIVRRPDPKWTSYLATGVFKKMIMATGACKNTELSGIKIALIDAKKFLNWHLLTAKQYGWPFWGFPRKRG